MKFLIIALSFILISNVLGMEESDSEDIESQVSEVSEPMEVKSKLPMNINVNIMGFDPATEDGQKKMIEIMDIVQKLVHEGERLATAKKTEPEQH